MSKRISNIAKDTNSKKPKHWSLGLLETMRDPEYVIKKTKNVVVIKDKYPKSKIHYLVIPNEDLRSIFKLSSSHVKLLEEFKDVYYGIQEEMKDVKLRAGFHSVPSMQRLHMHIISTDMVSPCLKTKIHWNTFTTKFFIPLEDLLEELKKNGSIQRISNEKHEEYIKTPLQCNQCEFKPKNMPQLKEHLLTHCGA